MRVAFGWVALAVLSFGRGAIAQSIPTQNAAADLAGTQSRAVLSEGPTEESLNTDLWITDLQSTDLQSTALQGADAPATEIFDLDSLRPEVQRPAAPFAEVSATEISATEISPAEASATELLDTEIAPTQPRSEISETLKLELKLSERRLLVYRGELLIANYPVAVGREGWQTPTGEFSVFQKQANPTWEHPFTGELVPPGPGNPLGSRWIGFWSDGENSIGFHGTPDESVIGQAVSHGCVRMRDEDVLALYEQVSMDTLVVVLP